VPGAYAGIDGGLFLFPSLSPFLPFPSLLSLLLSLRGEGKKRGPIRVGSHPMFEILKNTLIVELI